MSICACVMSSLSSGRQRGCRAPLVEWHVHRKCHRLRQWDTHWRWRHSRRWISVRHHEVRVLLRSVTTAFPMHPPTGFNLLFWYCFTYLLHLWLFCSLLQVGECVGEEKWKAQRWQFTGGISAGRLNRSCYRKTTWSRIRGTNQGIWVGLLSWSKFGIL